MLIDAIAFFLLLFAIFKGIRKGLIVAVFSFLGFIIGLAAALKLSALVAEYISENAEISQRWLPFISFILVFFFVLILVRLGAKFLEGAVRLVMLGWLNRLGGIFFFVLIYFFIFSIILFYAAQLHVINPATLESSVTYPLIRPIAPQIINVIGAVIPFFRDIFSELLEFFDKMSDQ